MKKYIPFVFLILLTAALAGTASAVFVSNSLERYAASLLNDRRFAALAPVQHGSSPATLEEALGAVQEASLNSMVFFVDEQMVTTTPRAPLAGGDFIQGEGVVVSADGWMLTTQSQLSRYADGGGVYSGFSVLHGYDTFVVEQVIEDTQTDAVAIRVQGAQGWTPLELAKSDEVISGETVFGIGMLGEVYTSSVVRRALPEGEVIVPIEEPRAVWQLAQSLSAGTPLLTSQAKLFGFMNEDGYGVPAQALRPFLKQVLRGSSVVHAGLGVFVSDLSQVSSHTQEWAQKYHEGVRVSLPLGARTATVKGGPADNSGLTVGDILLAIDDVAITKTTTPADILATYAPGQQITVRVARDGEVKDMPITLGAWEELVY